MPRGVPGSGPYCRNKAKPAEPLAQELVQPTEATAPAPAVQQLAEDDSGPLGSVDVDTLSGDVLRRYARRAGVSPRDVEGLTEDRLRQNIRLVIAEHFDLIMEG